MDDKKIILLYQQRNEKAISETDKAHGGFCRRVALNILSYKEDAEECVNDTYHAAWRAIPPEEPASLRAFLGRIVRNLSISRFRAQRAKKRYSNMETLLSELDDCVPAPLTVEQEVEARELSRYISDWLDYLKREDADLFVRRYWYGQQVKKLASWAGSTENAVSAKLFRLRSSLRSYLEERGVTI